MGRNWVFPLSSNPELPLTLIVVFLGLLLVRGLTQRSSVLTRWPLVGMFPSLLANAHRIQEWTTEVMQKSGGNFLFKGPPFAAMDILVTADPANVGHATSTAHAFDFPKGADSREIFDVLGDGLLNADSDSWRVQRKWAHFFMRQRRFRGYVESTGRKKVEEALLPLLLGAANEGGEVDLQDVMQRFMFDATCLFVCGFDPGCLSVSFPVVEFGKAVDDAKEIILNRHTVPTTWWKLLRWLRVGNERAMAEATRVVDRCVAEFISSRRKELDSEKKKKNKNTDKKVEERDEVDLLTSYMAYEADEEMEKMKSDKFLRDVILNMLVAGRDTTSSALTWFFWEISRNPETEAKILDELRSLLTKLRRQPEEEIKKLGVVVFGGEELGGLIYLHAALSESLRLYPPVPLIQKCATTYETFPSGHKVRPGLKMICCLYAMARMESVWGKDCNEFKPERWISEEGRLRTDYSDKFFTFNAGPRSCFGKDIAFTQMKIIAAAVLYNFHVEAVKDQIVRPKTSVVLCMENGLKVKIKKR